jgi:hypothetical protein
MRQGFNWQSILSFRLECYWDPLLLIDAAITILAENRLVFPSKFSGIEFNIIDTIE